VVKGNRTTVAPLGALAPAGVEPAHAAAGISWTWAGKNPLFAAILTSPNNNKEDV
jgi:hypothetical protein